VHPITSWMSKLIQGSDPAALRLDFRFAAI
jgi:hypothetical protein